MTATPKFVRIAFLAAAALAATACSHGGRDDTAFRWTDQLPAGSTVHIRDGAGDITLTRGAGQNVVVNGGRAWRRGHARDVQFVVEQRGNDYYVCAMWKNSGRCNDGGYKGRNSGGFLSMLSLFHRNSDATADFTAEIPANVYVDASTRLGSVQIEGVSGGVSARTINGTIRASNVSGSLSLTSTNGDIRLSANSFAPTDSIRLSTTNGSVHAELPSGLEGKFDLSAVNGMVRSDIPIPTTSSSKRHLVGQVGTATRTVKMRATNGQIILTTHAPGTPAAPAAPATPAAAVAPVSPSKGSH